MKSTLFYLAYKFESTRTEILPEVLSYDKQNIGTVDFDI